MGTAPNPEQQRIEPDVKLRHEFVGMMFAVTIGEVGIQVATLVHAGHYLHYFPAYSHLFLSTVIIATSWVGWSLSMAPGARQDVRRIFELPFLVLLIDVSLVISYFILVRSVDFPAERIEPRIAPESTVAFWVIAIFALFLFWDVVTKIFAYKKDINDPWTKNYGSRMIPTAACCILAIALYFLLKGADVQHYATADFALLFLALFFRASKDIVSAWTKGTSRRKPVLWALVCVLGMSMGTLWTNFFAIPACISSEIGRPILEKHEDLKKMNSSPENIPNNEIYGPPAPQ